MKKICLLLTLAAGISVAVNAQDKPIYFGVKAGVTFPNMDHYIGEISFGGKTKTSFYIGAIANIKLSDLFSVQSGLNYMNKGTKFDISITDELGYNERTEKASYNLSYIELPVNILANINVGTGKLFIGAGPYVAYALSGNNKSVDFKTDIKFGSDGGQFKRMDFGLNFLGGYQLNNGLNIHASYGLGIYDYSSLQNVKAKNKVFSVGLGFNF